MSEPIRDVEVLIEVPRYGLVKRELRPDGGFRLDYVSPVPCPFNYGAVPDEPGADGDPVDAVVLGPTLAMGTRVRVPVWGEVRFVDAGLDDPKLICGERPPTPGDRLRLSQFFRVYAIVRAGLNLARGRRGPTRFGGLHLPGEPDLGTGRREMRVWSASTFSEARMVNDTLGAAGLHPRVVGEHRPSIAGEIPFPDARVEVWVPTLEAAEAKALLRDLDEAAAAPPWTCAGCGEENPATFATCWKCQSARRRPRAEPA